MQKYGAKVQCENTIISYRSSTSLPLSEEEEAGSPLTAVPRIQADREPKAQRLHNCSSQDNLPRIDQKGSSYLSQFRHE